MATNEQTITDFRELADKLSSAARDEPAPLWAHRLYDVLCRVEDKLDKVLEQSVAPVAKEETPVNVLRERNKRITAALLEFMERGREYHVSVLHEQARSMGFAIDESALNMLLVRELKKGTFDRRRKGRYILPLPRPVSEHPSAWYGKNEGDA